LRVGTNLPSRLFTDILAPKITDRFRGNILSFQALGSPEGARPFSLGLPARGSVLFPRSLKAFNGLSPSLFRMGFTFSGIIKS